MSADIQDSVLRGPFVVTSSRLGIGTVQRDVSGAPKAVRFYRAVRFSFISSVDVIGGQVAKNKVGAVVAFGVLGGLAAKGSKNEATVIVHTTDGETAYFTVDKKSPVEIRAKLGPIFKEFGVKLVDNAGAPSPVGNTSTASTSDLAQRLRELAALRDDGLLTEEEFNIQKSRILDPGIS
jgi:Short C-terminal domain